MTGNLMPCPHCGFNDLVMNQWSTDDGEIDAVECRNCESAAPLEVWNKRLTNLTNRAEFSLNYRSITVFFHCDGAKWIIRELKGHLLRTGLKVEIAQDVADSGQLFELIGGMRRAIDIMYEKSDEPQVGEIWECSNVNGDWTRCHIVSHINVIGMPIEGDFDYLVYIPGVLNNPMFGCIWAAQRDTMRRVGETDEGEKGTQSFEDLMKGLKPH